MLSGGGLAAGVFAFLHGSGNGVLTIARGAVPLAIYGPVNYGYRLGLLGAPARMAQAAAPFLFGVLITELSSISALQSSCGFRKDPNMLLFSKYIQNVKLRS